MQYKVLNILEKVFLQMFGGSEFCLSFELQSAFRDEQTA
jgi:hypothetical protein